MPILEAQITNRRQAWNHESILRFHDFQWSRKQACWWRLAPADEAQRIAAELEKQLIQVEVLP